MLLHTGVFWTRTHLGRGTFTFYMCEAGLKHDLGEVSGHFWNQVSILFCFHREMLLHTSASTQGGPSHSDSFTQRDDFIKGCSYTEILSTQRCFYTRVL